MIYEYSGYLKTILQAPDPAVRESLDCVTFNAEDLAHWTFKDRPSDPEWQLIPVNCKRTEGGVRLEGRFTDIRQIDNLASDDPSFWVPLSSMNWHDDRFPVDTSKYPIIEITYRCTSSNARPAWVWTYPGGMHFDGLAPTLEWRTVARRAQHYGFPSQVDAVILRLYSTSRSIESVEVESIRFRAMSETERNACSAHEAQLEQEGKPKPYPILDEFMPFGCYMDAGSSKRLAAMLGISLPEYWALVLEDLARHNHNCIALEGIDRFTTEEWQDLLKQAVPYGVKFYAIHHLPFGTLAGYWREFVENHIKPYAESPSILAWSLHDEPPEHGFETLLKGRACVEKADPNHPMVIVLRDPNAFPLYARFFPVTGITNYVSHSPRGLGELVRTHLPLSRGQQFWPVAPGFIYATDTPEWHTGPEMRLMMNLAFANGARGWFTFSYHNDPIWIRGSFQRSLTGPFLTFSDLWSELSQRVEFYSAVAPLLLKTSPAPAIEEWFKADSVAHANALLPEGVSPIGIYRLCAEDYELYCVVSNEVREMTTVYINIQPPVPSDWAVYDLSDFVQTRQWAPVDRQRHLEMFPGQQHILLATRADLAEHWRDVIARRMVENDLRHLAFDLPLAQTYGLNTSAIEKMTDAAARGQSYEALDTMRVVRNQILDLIYESSAISESRSKLIEISAAICACDGSLCRLLGRGKVDQARQMGFKVIPLARELSHLRLELRKGKGAAILEQCQRLAERSLGTLGEIRGIS